MIISNTTYCTYGSLPGTSITRRHQLLTHAKKGEPAQTSKAV